MAWLVYGKTRKNRSFSANFDCEATNFRPIRVFPYKRWRHEHHEYKKSLYLERKFNFRLLIWKLRGKFYFNFASATWRLHSYWFLLLCWQSVFLLILLHLEMKTSQKTLDLNCWNWLWSHVSHKDFFAAFRSAQIWRLWRKCCSVRCFD